MTTTKSHTLIEFFDLWAKITSIPIALGVLAWAANLAYGRAFQPIPALEAQEIMLSFLSLFQTLVTFSAVFGGISSFIWLLIRKRLQQKWHWNGTFQAEEMRLEE